MMFKRSQKLDEIHFKKQEEKERVQGKTPQQHLHPELENLPRHHQPTTNQQGSFQRIYDEMNS